MSLLSRGRWLSRLCWALVCVALLWLLLWTAAPRVFKSQLEKQASAQLGRQVHVGRVEFAPWSLSLTLHDLSIDRAIKNIAEGQDLEKAEARNDVKNSELADALQPSPQLEIQRIFVNASAQSLWRLAPVLEAIEIDAPVLRLTQHAVGQLDIDDVMARLTEPKTKEPSSPLNFALYNIAVRNGRVELRDEALQTDHLLKDLELGIPFISNLTSKLEVKVLPHLAFDLNGSSFDSRGESTPFAANRQTAMELKWHQIDLKPYLGYVPARVPIKPQSGVLDADLRIHFEQHEYAQLSISGTLGLSQVQLQDSQGAPLLNFDLLQLQLKELQPLQRKLSLDEVRWVNPEIFASRDKSGVINWLGLAAAANKPESQARADTGSSPDAVAKAESAEHIPSTEPTQSPELAGESANATAASPAQTAEAPQPWAAYVGKVEVQGGRVHWRDAAVGGQTAPAALSLAPLALQIDHVRWPLAGAAPPAQASAASSVSVEDGAVAQAMQLNLSTQILQSTAAQSGQVSAQGAALKAQGQISGAGGRLDLQLQQLPLQWLRPYIEAHFKPQLGATLQADAQLAWSEAGVSAHIQQLTADGVQLTDAQAPASVQRIQLAGVQVDLAQQEVVLESVSVQKPQLTAQRDAQGRWMYERWLPSAPAGAGQQARDSRRSDAQPGGGSAAASKPWNVKLQALVVDDGKLSLRDALPVAGYSARPVAVELNALRVRLGAWQPLATKAAPSPLELSARIGAGRRTQAGSLGFRGQLGLSPVTARGQVQLASLPLHAFEPYFGHKLHVDLVRAEAGFRGQVDFGMQGLGPQLSVKGDAELNDMRVRSALAAPVQPSQAKPESAKAALTAILNDSTADRAQSERASGGVGLGGHDDLLAWKTLAVKGLDLSMKPEQALRVSVRETALSDFFARVIVQRNGRLNLQDIVRTQDSEQSVAQNEPGQAAPNPPESAASPEASKPAGPAPIIHVGPMVLTGGKVQFSDYFIQPNYSADLSELQGRLSAFSSGQQTSAQSMDALELADLEIKGRAQGTATLDISGKINPLAQPLALDVRAQMRDLELSPLTPYSIKYAGHGIERGKLHMDVNYKVQPSGELTATNQLVLHQLTFGDKVEGAPASLPVRLAVALLADRNGVIDLDVPISGSLNDPQFRLAPIIWKVIGNLITKAVTAPFALLSGAFAGGDESGVVSFAPGSARLDTTAKEQLGKVVKALTDRPALKMTVVGEAHAQQDEQAWKQVQLDRLLLAEKRRQAIRADKKAEEVTEFSEGERPALLKAVYNRADIKKPRNMVGLAKDLPAEQMTALLLSNMTVPDNAMRELAQERGVAVRDYLATQNLPLDRLFLGAPKLDAGDEKWTPRAQLSLSAQ